MFGFGWPKDVRINQGFVCGLFRRTKVVDLERLKFRRSIDLLAFA